MPYALVLDILVALLLVVTIGYAWVLNKRLGNLRRDKGELEKMALDFHMATDRAEESIARLKVNVDALQVSMDKAETLRDDLVFLTERGGAAADRLEIAVRAARDEAGVSPAPAKPAAQTKPMRDIPAGIKPEPEPSRKPQTGRPPLTADPGDRAVGGGDQDVTEAERELLRALRSAG